MTESEDINRLARQLWPSDGERGSYQPKLITTLLTQELRSGDSNRIQRLENSGYLERYLWSILLTETSQKEEISWNLVFSIIILMNSKLHHETSTESSIFYTFLTKKSENFIENDNINHCFQLLVQHVIQCLLIIWNHMIEKQQQLQMKLPLELLFQKYMKKQQLRSTVSTSDNASNSSSTSSASASVASSGTNDVISSDISGVQITNTMVTFDGIRMDFWLQEQLLSWILSVFQVLDLQIMKEVSLCYVSLPIWSHLSEERRQIELQKNSKLATGWYNLLEQKKKYQGIVNGETTTTEVRNKKRSSSQQQHDDERMNSLKKLKTMERDSNFIPILLCHFSCLLTILFDSEKNEIDGQYRSILKLAEKQGEFLLYLFSSPQTRRFIVPLVDDWHCLSIWAQLTIPQTTNHILTPELTTMWTLFLEIRRYLLLEYDDNSGTLRDTNTQFSRSHDEVTRLQSVLYASEYSERMLDCIFSSTAELMKPNVLRSQLALLSTSEMTDIAVCLEWISKRDMECWKGTNDTKLSSEIESTLRSFLETLFLMKIRPLLTQKVITAEDRTSFDRTLDHFWTPWQVEKTSSSDSGPTPIEDWTVSTLGPSLLSMKVPPSPHVVSLPKLNLSFLSFRDYLQRCQLISHYEAASEVASDVMDVIRRMKPTHSTTADRVTYQGWARMGCAISGVRIDSVGAPKVGENFPSRVVASLEIDISRLRGADLVAEWEQLREHDVIFLIAPALPKAATQNASAPSNEKKTSYVSDEERKNNFIRDYGVPFVRVAEIFEIRDEEDVIVAPRDPTQRTPRTRAGTKRRFRFNLDPAQYALDLAAQANSSNSCVTYDSVSLVMRREGRANTFKSILATIENLLEMSEIDMRRSIPSWATDLLLGRGDPNAANFRTLLAVGSVEDHSSEESVSDEELIVKEMLNKASQALDTALDAGLGSMAAKEAPAFDFVDTFLDAAHVRDAFADYSSVWMRVAPSLDTTSPFVDLRTHENLYTLPSGPYRIQFLRLPAASKSSSAAPSIKRARAAASRSSPVHASEEVVLVTPYTPAPRGPYVENIRRKQQTVRYTAAQVEALRSGMSEGLSLVVGPPGTGKTDVAVQLMVNLYHATITNNASSSDDERWMSSSGVTSRRGGTTLLITQSNSALNDIFEKAAVRDIDPRHLVRLGGGEVALRAALTASGLVSNDNVEGQDNSLELMFSKTGRVNYCLTRRLQLLAQVQRLAESLSISGDVGHSCETASLFYDIHCRPRLVHFDKLLKEVSSNSISREQSEVEDTIKKLLSKFPFATFFSDVPLLAALTNSSTLPSVETFPVLLNTLNSCQDLLRGLFSELRDYRPLELLRSHAARCEHLVSSQARVVAMTTTHAAMSRDTLLAARFQYDTLIIEEASQIADVETLIPFLLQANDASTTGGAVHKLRRVILIGDHHQLPPIVKSPLLVKHCGASQSLFTRLIRFGVPHVLLDVQGRARPQLAELYAWRYAQRIVTVLPKQKQIADAPAEQTRLAANGATTITTKVSRTGVVTQITDLRLGNLPSVMAYSNATPVLSSCRQFIDVGDYDGHGETTPAPHFYQNLGEALFVVLTYQLLRRQGYPASSISIITTYNGQKQLLEDVLRTHCGKTSGDFAYGMPAQVSTVDKFQGQQNDIILLSLVRTTTPGHLRDIRRLVVALSRARFGLLVFGRKSVFDSVADLQPALKFLWKSASVAGDSATPRYPLRVVANETYPSTSRSIDDTSPENTLEFTSPEQLGEYLHRK